MPTAPLLYGDKSQARFDCRQVFRGSAASCARPGWGSSRRARGQDRRDARATRSSSARQAGNRSGYVRAPRERSVHTKIRSFTAQGPAEEFQSIERGELDGLFMSGWSGPGRAMCATRSAPARCGCWCRWPPKKTRSTPRHRPSWSRERRRGSPDRRVGANRMLVGRPFIAPPEIPASGWRSCGARSRRRSKTGASRGSAEAAARDRPHVGRRSARGDPRLYRTPPPGVGCARATSSGSRGAVTARRANIEIRKIEDELAAPTMRTLSSSFRAVALCALTALALQGEPARRAFADSTAARHQPPDRRQRRRFL